MSALLRALCRALGWLEPEVVEDESRATAEELRRVRAADEEQNRRLDAAAAALRSLRAEVAGQRRRPGRSG